MRLKSRRPPERPEPGAKVFGYGRASTNKQDATIDAQSTQTKGYFDWKLQPQGLEWAGFFPDPKTSSTIPFSDRTAGRVVASAVRRGDHIVISKFDRAFRSLGDAFTMLEGWAAAGVYVHFLDLGMDTFSPWGELLVGFLAIFARFERRRIAERTKEVLAEKRARGDYPKAAHQPPMFMKRKHRYDQKKMKRVVSGAEWDDYALKVGKKIYELRENGETLEQIGLKLRLAKVTNRRGRNRWAPSTVHDCYHHYAKLLAAGELPEYARPECSPPSPASASTISTATPPPPSSPSGDCST